MGESVEGIEEVQQVQDDPSQHSVCVCVWVCMYAGVDAGTSRGWMTLCADDECILHCCDVI